MATDDPKRALAEKVKDLRKLVRAAEKAAGTGGAGDYAAHREKMAAKSRAQSAAGAEVGPLPAVADPARRLACSRDFKLFCETYLGSWFPLAWSDDHLAAIDRMQTSILSGGQFAFAMPRGSGKSSLSEGGVLFATLNGHRRFVVFVGASEDAAKESLATVRTEVETNDLLAADFPEVCHPVRALEGANMRTGKQTVDGTRTRITWADAKVTFPTVKGSPSSGVRVRVAGITGRIRGMKATTASGNSIRPDLCIVDDPQTDDSATSPTQNAKREKILNGAVLGLAGPKKKIACFVPCTVIAPGDLADRILDRERHPAWQGQRCRMVLAWPENKVLWDRYADLRRVDMRAGGGGRPATELYLANQAEMDSGSRVSWDQRFDDDEVSGIQHAMNLLIDRGERTFNAEFQNDPMPELDGLGVEDLDPDHVVKRVNNCPRGVVPAGCTRLTAAIDVQGNILYWCVCAWTETFGGAVVDYGTFPKQNRDYFAASDARPSLEDVFPTHDVRERIFAGLKTLVPALLTRDFRCEVGDPLRVQLCFVDSGYEADAIHDFCRQNLNHRAALQPAHGFGVTASGKPVAEWVLREGERKGDDWVIRPHTGTGRGRTCVFDANAWKTFVAQRLLTPGGGRSCLWLFGDGKGAHQLFADHLNAEYWVRTEGRGRKLDEWKERPDRRDNHYLDCLTNCAVAASVSGLRFDAGAASGDPRRPREARKRVKLSDVYAQKNGGRR